MPKSRTRSHHAKPQHGHAPEEEKYHEDMAKFMIEMFGAAAASKAIEIVRMQTTAGDREGAVRWHRVMSLIEDSRRIPRQ